MCELCHVYHCCETCLKIDFGSGKHTKICFQTEEDHKKLRLDFELLSGLTVPGVKVLVYKGTPVLIFPGPVEGDVPPSMYYRDTMPDEWDAIRRDLGVKEDLFFYLIPVDQATRVWFLEMTDEQRKTLGEKLGNAN